MPLRTLFVDLNSFFASVEQQLDPALRGRPVAVVPMMDVDTTAVLAASYAAKRFGVRTGTKVGEARRLCPGLVLVKARHTAYVEFHHKVIDAADTVLPISGVHSIDEFSARLLGDQQHPEAASRLARGVKRAIAARAGECLTCSIGLAPNRLLAKMGSDMQKPDGLVVLEDHTLRQQLLTLTLRDVPGIGPRMEQRLVAAGVRTMADLLARDEPAMLELWGSVWGAFYYHALRGSDLAERPSTRRSIGHQHVLGPEKRTDELARAVCVRLLDKAAARARHLGYWARQLTLHVRALGPRGSDRDFVAAERFPETHDTTTLLHALDRLWQRRRTQAPAHARLRPLRVGVTLSDLRAGMGATLPLFAEDQKAARISAAIDAINQKLGRSAIYPASMHAVRKSAPARIAFRSIPDLSMPHVRESRDDEGPVQQADDPPTGSAPR